MSPQPAPLLSASHISVKYGDVHALDDVSIAVHPGHIRALIGTNGSGKSTLFKALMGLIEPESGHVQANGDLRPGTIAYVPQSEAVDWHFPFTVRDVVTAGRFGGKHGAWWRRLNGTDAGIIADALDRTGLTEYQHRQIGQLSGGQKKRTFIARSLAQQASVLLLDEPFAGVDTTNQHQITQLLWALARDGMAILVSTHDLDHLQELADDVTLLNRRIIAEGAVEEVLTAQNLMSAFGTATARKDCHE